MPLLSQTELLRRLKRDIVDADVSADAWDDWLQATMDDLYADEIEKDISVQVVITTTGGAADESYAIPDTIEDVYALELRTTNGQHDDYLSPDEWEVQERTLRLFTPAISGTQYWLRGRGRYTLSSDLRDTFTGLVYHEVRKRYIEKRQNDRANFYLYVLADPKANVSDSELMRLKAESMQQVESRKRMLKKPDPAVPVGDARG